MYNKSWFHLLNGRSTFVGFFYAEAIFVEEQLWYYITYGRGIRRSIPLLSVLVQK